MNTNYNIYTYSHIIRNSNPYNENTEYNLYYEFEKYEKYELEIEGIIISKDANDAKTKIDEYHNININIQDIQYSKPLELTPQILYEKSEYI